MPVPRARTNSVAGSPAGSTETVIASIPPGAIPAGLANDPVDLIGDADIGAIGTSGVSVTLNIRRGTGIAGTILGTRGPVTVAAGNRYQVGIHGTDVEAGQGYVLTATVGSAAAGSTVNNAHLRADW